MEQEQLGDLKLYRVPDRTTVASRQSKQVRLLDRAAIPVSWIYGADLAADRPTPPAPASLVLRTKNDAAHHLGQPLPSGRIAVFTLRGSERLLHIIRHARPCRRRGRGNQHGDISDVQVTAEAGRVDISNARAGQIQFELRLQLPQGSRIIRADHPLGAKNGRPIFRLTIPARATVLVRYRTEHAAG